MSARQFLAAMALALPFLASCGNGDPASQSRERIWAKTSDASPWGLRDAGAVSAHDGRLWILGGWTLLDDESTYIFIDTWSTRNGIAWTSYAPPPWSFGMYPMATSFQDRLLMMGGLKDSRGPHEELSNEVWGTVDGNVWTLLRDHADWEPRIGSTLVQFKGEIWILGGKTRNSGDPQFLRNDVWSSTDGITWRQVSTSAAWMPRAFHCAVAFADRMWVIGGGDWDARVARSDVWSSNDGAIWERHADAPWKGRIWHSCVSYDSKIWVMGGRLFDPIRTVDEIWTTSDGESWQLFASAQKPGPRHAAYTAIFNDRIWVLGGSADGFLQPDVWQYF